MLGLKLNHVSKRGHKWTGRTGVVCCLSWVRLKSKIKHKSRRVKSDLSLSPNTALYPWIIKNHYLLTVAMWEWKDSNYTLQINTLRPRKTGRHFSDDIFKWILITISLEYVPRGPTDHIPALIQILTWRRPEDKSFSDPLIIILLTLYLT